MPTASSPTEDFHRLLMTGPTGFPPYNGIPDGARWNGDVFNAMNRLQNLRRSFQTPSRFQSVSKTGMEGQRLRLLAASGAKPAGPAGRIAGDLTNHVFVGQAIERYWAGTRSAGRPKTSLSQAVHGSLLADIYTVTGRFMRDISRNTQLRTDNDCALFPLYRALHFAAADVFGVVYGINGDEIEIYLQKQLIGLTAHGKHVDEQVGNIFPNQGTISQLVYLSDQEALACRLHIKDGRFWIVSARGGLELFDCSGENFKLDDDRGITNTAYLGTEDNNDLGVAGFAMGHNRDIYASFHTNRGAPKGSFYHSAYMAGREVLCTGCITVVKGKLTYINNASGHYQPNQQQLSLAVQTLRAQGVDISHVTVQRYDPTARDGFSPAESAIDFLKSQQGAGFTEGRLAPPEKIAAKIREALTAYERRANSFWSQPSRESRQALGRLKLIGDHQQLVDEVKFLLGDSENSPFFTATGLRLKADGELAKQLRRCL